ncbi:MAG: hypothetical protein ACJLS2_06045 [Microcella pacifica]
MAWRSSRSASSFLHPHGRSEAERVDGVVVGAGRVAEHRAPERQIDVSRARRYRDLHFAHSRSIGGRAVRACHRRHGPGELDVLLVEEPDVPCEAHRDPGLGEGQQRLRTRAARRLGHAGGERRRIGEGRAPEERRGATVQHDPVLHALRGEELPPPGLAHARLPTLRGDDAGMPRRWRRA